MRLTVWDEPSKRVQGAGAIRYYDPITGLKARARYQSKEERRLEKTRIELWLRNWKPGKGNPGAIPLVIFEDYLAALITDELRPRRKGTISLKRQSLTKLLNSVFQIQHLTTDKIKAWRSELLSHYSVDSVSIKLRDLRSFCRWCVKTGVLDVNPFVGINIPVSTFVGRRLNLNELQGLYANLSEKAQVFVDICIATGARKGEILALEWTDIDFERRYWLLPGREGKSKGRRDRIIPLKDKALAALKRLPQMGQFVFDSYKRDDFKRDWKRALRLSEIKGRVRPHDLRHTWASEFKGRSDALKRIAGWTTDTMLAKYRHTEVEELREDLEKSQFGVDLGHLTPKSDNNA